MTRHLHQYILVALVVWALAIQMPSRAHQADTSSSPLINLSLNLLAAGGGSTADPADLELFQSGKHDPKQNGFTLQGAEISLSGRVDPFFAAAHVVADADHVELEEAYLTSALGSDALELKVGQYLTEFGLINSTHPHSWDWIDQPFIATRLLGPEGLRSAGARVAWQTQLPGTPLLIFGAQNADHSSAISFLGADHEFHHAVPESNHHDHTGEDDGEIHLISMAGGTVGGRPSIIRDPESVDELLFSGRFEQKVIDSETTGLKIGISALWGPNSSSEDGETQIHGADISLDLYRPGPQMPERWLRWQTEIMSREFRCGELAIPLASEFLTFPSETIRDWGIYSQIALSFLPRWETGLRIEYASGNDAGVIERDDDPLRADRWRISPLVAFRPSEHVRIRLQYNYDESDAPPDSAHTVWVGIDGSLGTH